MWPCCGPCVLRWLHAALAACCLNACSAPRQTTLFTCRRRLHLFRRLLPEVLQPLRGCVASSPLRARFSSSSATSRTPYTGQHALDGPQRRHSKLAHQAYLPHPIALAGNCVDRAPAGGSCTADQCDSTAYLAGPYCLKTCGRCTTAAA